MSDADAQVDRVAVEQLAALLLERVGLKITPDGYYGLRLALSARMPVQRLTDAQEYVRRLKQASGEPELRALLPLVTVGKTEFFRDARQFDALEKAIVPRLLREARASGRQARIWTAGCATGEEPYSVAMVALEAGALPSELSIWATDLNPVAVENASKGHFPLRRMMGVSERRLERFFQELPHGFQVKPEVQALIRFEPHNLAASMFPAVAPGSLDLIMCRNVIIYFDVPTIEGLMQRFWESLRPDGVMLLGYSESLFRVATRFEMFELEGTFAYRPAAPGVAPRSSMPRPSSPQQVRPTPPLPTSRATAPEPPPAPRGAPAPGQRATAPPPPPARSSAPRPPPPPSAPRLAVPAPPPSAPRPSAPLPPPPPRASAPRVVPEERRSPVERLELVVQRMEQGDFPHALLAAQRLVHDHPDDLAGLLTLGNIHSLMGAADAAKECFASALAKEPLCVEARLFLGVGALQQGALGDARAELKRALFLEPTLVLGHYLLGQVEEQAGDAMAARRAYRNAIAQKRARARALLGHFPDVPRSVDAVVQSAQFRLAALGENER